jgi:hypothetical protein
LQSCFEFINDELTTSSIALAGGGGGSHMASCGAFSGGLMALSAKFCSRSRDYTDQEIAELEEIRSKFYEFRDWFAQEFGGVKCPDVLQKLFGFSFHSNTEEEYVKLGKIHEKLGFDCGLVMQKVTVKVAEIITRDA